MVDAKSGVGGVSFAASTSSGGEPFLLCSSSPSRPITTTATTLNHVTSQTTLLCIASPLAVSQQSGANEKRTRLSLSTLDLSSFSRARASASAIPLGVNPQKMLQGQARLGARAGGRSSRSSSGSGAAPSASASLGLGGGVDARRTTRGQVVGAVVTRPTSSSRLQAASTSSGNSTSSSNTNNGSTPLFAPDAPSAAAARQELFNSISPVYDELNDRLSFGMHRVWKRMAVRWALRGDGGAARIVAAEQPRGAQPPPPRRALDVCCGSGDLALLLADALEAEWGRYPGGARSSSSSSPLEVVGLDFAAEMLADASRREKRERRRPLVAEQQNAGGNLRSSSSSSSTTPQRTQIQWVQGDATNLPFSDASFGAATVGYGLRNVADQPQALKELARVLSPGGHLAVLDFNNAKGSGDWIADAAQGFFLERVVVPEATKFGLREQYAYLRPSVHSYPSGDELERMAREAGFRYARHYPLAFGMMGCLVATR